MISICNCIKEVKEEIKVIFEKKDNVEEVTELSIENTAFMFTKDSWQTQLYSPVTVEFNYRNKKKELKHKKEKVNMSYKYCPFCGEEYKK